MFVIVVFVDGQLQVVIITHPDFLQLIVVSVVYILHKLLYCVNIDAIQCVLNHVERQQHCSVHNDMILPYAHM